MVFVLPISVCRFCLKTTWLSAIAGTLMRIVLLWHGTLLVNSLAQYSGDRPYATEHTSRDDKLVSWRDL